MQSADRLLQIAESEGTHPFLPRSIFAHKKRTSNGRLVGDSWLRPQQLNWRVSRISHLAFFRSRKFEGLSSLARRPRFLVIVSSETRMSRLPELIRNLVRIEGQLGFKYHAGARRSLELLKRVSKYAPLTPSFRHMKKK